VVAKDSSDRTVSDTDDHVITYVSPPPAATVVPGSAVPRPPSTGSGGLFGSASLSSESVDDGARELLVVAREGAGEASRTAGRLATREVPVPLWWFAGITGLIVVAYHVLSGEKREE